MSIIERSVLADPGLLAALPEAESPRCWVSAGQVTQGAERDLPLGTEPAPPRRAGPLAFLGGSWMPRWARGDRVDRWFGGVARWGVAGSSGATLHAAMAEADGLVVTDHHLVAVVQGTSAMVDDPAHPGRMTPSSSYRSTWRCPLVDLVAARRVSRLVGRGRVELFFRDASMCAVLTGVVSTAGARRLTETLALPETPS